MDAAHVLLAREVDRLTTPTGFCKAAALSWLLYDYFLTIDTEVEYIWKRRWGTVTLLYFMSRYIPLFIVIASSLTNFLPNVSPATCDLFQWIEAGGTFIIFIVVQIILQFRLFVMYGKSRKVLFVNALLCAAELGCAVALVAIVFPKTIPLPNSPEVFGSCFSHSPSEIAVVLVAPLAYETYLALLALRKVFQDTRSAVGKKKSIMTLLVRDNIIYFFLIAGVLIFVTLVWFFEPVTPGNSLITFTHVSGSIGGTRLIVNVRHVALHSDDDGADTSISNPIGFEMQARHRSRMRSLHRSEGASFGGGGGGAAQWPGGHRLSSLYELSSDEDCFRAQSGGAPLTESSMRTLNGMRVDV